MSIYSCIDDIEEILKNGSPSNPPGFLLSHIPFLQIFYRPRSQPWREEERVFLEGILTDLKELDGNLLDKEQKLNELIEKIDESPLLGSINSFSNALKPIISDLHTMKDGRPHAGIHRVLSISEQTVEEQYKALLNSSLLIKPLTQGNMKSLGNSIGECYGFTLSMVDSDSSPYKNPNLPDIELTKAIYDYQKNQLDREKDQAAIKRTRLTIKRFCPSLNQQAEELYKLAAKHVGEELGVTLYSRLDLHSTYLSVQPDNKIRYTDPNHGVFLFEDKDQFIAAYKLMYLYDNQYFPDATYKFYGVSKLQEDKDNQLKESITAGGKWRSFLTGRKYQGMPLPEPAFWPSTLVSTLGGVALGILIGNTVPIIGPITGGVVGGLIGAASGFRLANTAINNKHQGLLGTYHFLREKTYDAGESVKAKLGIRRECDEVPRVNLPTQSSHANMTALGLAAGEQNTTDAASLNGASAQVNGQDSAPELEMLTIIEAQDPDQYESFGIQF